MAERYEIELDSGRVLHMLWNGDDAVYGYVSIERDGRARVWRKTWVDEYAPTGDVFPGFVSAARALILGWV